MSGNENYTRCYLKNNLPVNLPPFYKTTSKPIKMSGNENYTRCYLKSNLPVNLPPKPEESKEKNTLEGFTNINDVIYENGIHVNTIIYTSLVLFAGYIYMHNVIMK